jgi:hypothetical protein
MASKAVEGSDRDAELATPRPANANRLGTGMSPGPTPRFTGDDSPLVRIVCQASHLLLNCSF